MTLRPLTDGWDRVPPVTSLILVISISLVSFVVVGPLIGLGLSALVFDISLMDLATKIGDVENNPGLRGPLYLTQGVTTFTSFVLFPYLYARRIFGIHAVDIFGRMPSPSMSLLTLVVVVVFMGFNSIFIEWNAGLVLPEALSGFESWARDFEERARVLTDYLTTFDGPFDIWIALIVIALLPAIGEEFVFRGLVQNHVSVISGNMHLAIWIAAFLFSLFHVQFFGFVPRLLLGALFGYLYAWSGNLSFPIIAHFVNNGFTLVMIYLYKRGAVNFDIESTETVSITTVLVSLIFSGGLLYLFWSHFQRKDVYER